MLPLMENKLADIINRSVITCRMDAWMSKEDSACFKGHGTENKEQVSVPPKIKLLCIPPQGSYRSSSFPRVTLY